jgi:predicted Zn-dependent protease
VKLWLSPLVIAAGLTTISLLGGCTTNPATGQQSYTAFMSSDEEKRVGAEEHGKVMKEYGGSFDHNGVAAYVTGIGTKLVANSELAGQPFTFTVLDSEIVNAFALPGGFVYVTRGLLALASSEAELASVLGHEIGHVTGRHTAQRVSQANTATILTGGLAVLAGVLTGSSELGSVVSEIGGTGAGLYLQSFSREQEFEADSLGVRYMARAGYDPSAAAGFLAKLQAQSDLEAKLAGRDPNAGAGMMASHPRTQDRVAKAVTEATQGEGAKAQVALGKPATEMGREPFLARINRLPYGANPEEGVVRGPSFTLPAQRVRWSAPSGYALQNSAEAVLIVGQAAKARYDIAKASGSAANIVRDWGQSYGVRGLSRIAVPGGLDAAIGLIQAQTAQRQPMLVRLLVIKTDVNTAHRFQILGGFQSQDEIDRVARSLASSFTQLSSTEAAAFKPLRIEILTAGSDVQTRQLANQMPTPSGTEAARLFEILNGLAPGALPAPGTKIKLLRM